MKMSIMATVGLSLVWIESGMLLNFSCWLTAEATGKTKACAGVVTRYRSQLCFTSVLAVRGQTSRSVATLPN